MKQYNRIMLGAGGMYLEECLQGGYIGASFIKDDNLVDTPWNDESAWRLQMQTRYLALHPEKTMGTARNSVGFLWTICKGLNNGDIVLASDGHGGYHIGRITSDYYYEPCNTLSHRRRVEWLNVVISRQSMSQKLQNSTGSIGTCCNITKYAEEIERLIADGSPSAPQTAQVQAPVHTETYKERSLHRLLSNYLQNKNILSKTIFHESSNRQDQMQKWVHPDMVGVEYNEFQDTATRSLLKTAETKEYISLYSYELKRTIENDHQLKEYYFQALSNSSWANFGFLVAFEIADDLMEEIERLNRAFGIGVIKLSPYADDTQVLFPARKNELDYYTIDKLCRINPDFKTFMTKSTKVLNVTENAISDVKESLQRYCDKGFTSTEELMAYCNDNHIPC